MTAQSNGPLAGIRVIDLTQFLLGPYATQILGDLGADIIKIEEPSGDRQRAVGSAPVSKNMGSTFLNFNRNKRSVAFDLKSEDGKRALRKLILTGDIFIHNMRPKSIAALGFTYEQVAEIKPDIVYVEAVGFDPDGPYAGRQAFDDLFKQRAAHAGWTSWLILRAIFGHCRACLLTRLADYSRLLQRWRRCGTTAR